VALDINGEAAASTAADIRAAGGRRRASPSTSPIRRPAARSRARSRRKSARSRSWSRTPASTGATPFTGDADTVAKDWRDIMAVNSMACQRDARVPRPAAGAQGPHRQHRVDPVVHACAHAELGRYTTSKHGVLGFTRALAAELGREACASTHRPGFIETPLNEKVRATIRSCQVFLDHTPLGRAGTPDDIVGPAIFLASDLSAYVTGAIVMADGGYRTI